MTKVSRLNNLDEFALIERLNSRIKQLIPENVVGAGDDCAVVPNSFLGDSQSDFFHLFSTDVMLEHKHFKFDFMSASDLGYKILAVNLSDIAAMGGEPKFALLTLQLREGMELSVLDEIYSGISDLASKHSVLLLGGDTVKGEEFALGMTIVGVSTNPPILRTGASEGDDIWLSSDVGWGALGLAILENRVTEIEELSHTKALASYRRPIPRISLGLHLANNQYATSMIDISDGLLQDANHLAIKSSMNFNLELSAIPSAAKDIASFSLLDGLTGGDDYELLFTAPRNSRDKIASLSKSLDLPKLTLVGAVSESTSAYPRGVYIQDKAGKGLELSKFLEANGRLRAGYNHLS